MRPFSSPSDGPLPPSDGSLRVSGPAGAPILVLSSSVGTATELWRPQLAALTDRFRVVRVEHPGHGAAPSGDAVGGVDPPATLAALGARLLRLLDGWGIERVSYAGLSLGGMVGMWLAAYAPDRVERLALLCTSAYLPPVRGWRERAATVRAEGTAAIADTVVGRWFTPAFAAANPAVVAAHRAMLTAVDPTGYAACCEAIGGMDLRADLSRIVAPTLVIAGADDPATPVEHARVIAAGVPGARLEVLAGAAHLANVEQPERTTRLLLDHFGPVLS